MKMWSQDQIITNQKITCDNNIRCLHFRPPRESITMGPITCLSIAPTMLCCSRSGLPATPVDLVTSITLSTPSSRIATSSMTTSTSNYWGSVTLFWTKPPDMSSIPTPITLSSFKHRSLRERRSLGITSKLREMLTDLRWTPNYNL